jgi:hypothetical protein
MCPGYLGAYRCVLYAAALCGLAVAAWTVGKTPRCWRSPVMSSPWSTCGETAARRRNPPRSLARRPVPISTARPGASQWLTLDRSMTSRLEPGRSRPRSCSRSAGAQAMSSLPLNSAMVTPPAVGVERARPGAVVVAASVIRLLSGCGGTSGPGAAGRVRAAARRPQRRLPSVGSWPVREPVSRARTSPTVCSRLVGSGNGRWAWIW